MSAPPEFATIASRWLAAMVLFLWTTMADGQVRMVGDVSLDGVVETVNGEVVTLRDAAGTRHQVRVPLPGENHVTLAGGAAVAIEAEVRISGVLDASKLAAGQVVRFRANVDRTGKSDTAVKEIEVLDADTKQVGVVPDGDPPAKGSVGCTITASVKQAKPTMFVVALPPDNKFMGKGMLQFKLGKDVVCRLNTADVRRLAAGATITRLKALRLDADDLVARVLEAENPAAAAVADRGDDELQRKFQKLSDEPRKEPRLVRSRSGFFCFLTDVSDREWAIIEEKLERMATALERFLGRKRSGIVEGFIARDLTTFRPGVLEDDFGVEKIRRKEGVCVNSTLGNARRAVLYSCDSHGVIQHECVHGFCHVTFGSTGPTWLAEGIAELGNYWRDGEHAVEVPAGVMAFLQQAEPKQKLLEIAVPGRVDAGTWQDYAWRWALCHLLANNPNYSDRFRPLAVALMEQQPGASFERDYGSVAPMLSFEYEFFLQTIGNGYRSDLAAWPWRARYKPLASRASCNATVKAKAGWQGSGVQVERGRSYDVKATGTWRTSPASPETSADGAADGRGRLVAAILAKPDAAYVLGAEVALGAESTFKAAESGNLVLRCSDDWTQLSDNLGEVKVVITSGASP